MRAVKHELAEIILTGPDNPGWSSELGKRLGRNHIQADLLRSGLRSSTARDHVAGLAASHGLPYFEIDIAIREVPPHLAMAIQPKARQGHQSVPGTWPVKKVVRIIGRMNGGGPARQVAYLHRSLRGSFETILVIGAIEHGEHDMRYLLEDSIGVVEIPSMSRSVKVWSDLVSLVKITQLLLREKPDIVHTHTAKAGVLGRIAALLAGVPVRVHTYHGNVFQGYFGKRTSRLIIAIERMLNRVTTSDHRHL